MSNKSSWFDTLREQRELIAARQPEPGPPDQPGKQAHLHLKPEEITQRLDELYLSEASSFDSDLAYLQTFSLLQHNSW